MSTSKKTPPTLDAGANLFASLPGSDALFLSTSSATAPSATQVVPSVTVGHSGPDVVAVRQIASPEFVNAAPGRGDSVLTEAVIASETVSPISDGGYFVRREVEGVRLPEKKGIDLPDASHAIDARDLLVDPRHGFLNFDRHPVDPRVSPSSGDSLVPTSFEGAVVPALGFEGCVANVAADIAHQFIGSLPTVDQ